MSDQLFQETPSQQNPQETPEPQQTPPQSDNLFADKLSSITDETGRPKYGDVSTALDALKHSQQFIPQLQSEKKQAEEALAKLQEENEALKKAQEQALQQQVPQEPPAPAGLDAESIEKLLEEKLTAKQQASQQEANLNKVLSTLTSTFGNEAQAKVDEVAAANGLSKAELQELSKTKPQLVLNMFGGVTASPKPTGGGHQFGHQPPANEIPAPAKSMLRGATQKEIAEHMKQVQAYVYKKYDVQQ